MRGTMTMTWCASLAAAVAAGVACGAVTASEPGKAEHAASSGTAVPDLPFSDAIRVGDVLYLSGQIGFDPGTNALVPGGLRAETTQAMRNLRRVLETHGYALRDVVKCTAMLADMSKWAEFNAAYRPFFDGRYPARSAFGAQGLALGAQVEIECIAAKADGAG